VIVRVWSACFYPGDESVLELRFRGSQPSGRILPYLKSVTLLETEGNVVATVADSVHRIALGRRRAILSTVAKG
jgi:hypothetical protein